MTLRSDLMGALVMCLLSALAVQARAQDCAEGRVRVEGRCCWPEQTWSSEFARCDGAPTCPTGLVEHGDACVMPSTSASGGYGEAGALGLSSRTGSTADWPSSTGAQDAPTAWATQGRGEDEGLIIAAFVVFDVGWLFGLLGGFLNEVTTGGNSGWLSLAPLAGAMVGGLVDFGPGRGFTGFGYGFGIASVIFQAAGLIMMPIAFGNETTEVVFAPIVVTPDVTASIELSAPGSDVGLSMRARF